MQIDELIGYRKNLIYSKARDLLSRSAIAQARKYAFDKADQRNIQLSKFTEFLKDHGFVQLGMGAFGAVYEKPGYPWVFKIFTGDPAYRRYISYVIQNQSNPYVPKIKGGIIKINQNTFAIRIEKLEPFRRAASSKKILTLYQILRDARTVSDIYDKDMEWLRKNYPEIIDVLTAIGRSKGNWLDIHSKNLMMRGKTPVLADPVINPKTL